MNYELNQDEINLMVEALKYSLECGYEGNLSPETAEQYDAVRALLERLEPKPIKREGWVVFWASGGNSTIFETEVAEIGRAHV